MLYFSSSQLMYIWVPFNFAASDILGIFLWAPDARISVRHLSQGGMWDHRTCAASIRHCQVISLSSRTSLPPRQQQTEAPAHNWCYQSCSQSGGVSWYLTVVLNLHFPRGRWHEHLDTDYWPSGLPLRGRASSSGPPFSNWVVWAFLSICGNSGEESFVGWLHLLFYF